MDLASAIDEQRQWDRLMRMAQLGAIPGEGVDRACLTRLDREARRLLIGWAREIGADISIDAAANLFLRRAGTDPDAAPVLTGSHMDTQPQGGRFDGIYGVIAGLEVLEALHRTETRTRRAIEVVAWTNEEGGRFGPGCMGSQIWAGAREVADFADARDPDGVRFADALAAHLDEEADLPRRPLGGRPHAYVEAHIEQGPVLEAGKYDIGVVSGIQGLHWYEVTLTGAAAHAGTTPPRHRHDAIQAFVRAASELNSLMQDPRDLLRFTIGHMVVEPNTPNSVAGRVTFSIDLRHPDAHMLEVRGGAIERTIRGGVKGCEVAIKRTFAVAPIAFPPMIVETVERAVAAEHLHATRMASGAIHDAQFVAAICPAGMIFVPSRGGISHNPAEYTEPGQLGAGTRVLARTVAALAA